ncbi:hypothetical protein ACQI4F_08540 [Mycolicibacterium vaccae]|uniref:hypothetical protein n=1 Tax=Mycolicibacterium vaccae TaxID=1810 RepID=UPI003CF65EE7
MTSVQLTGRHRRSGDGLLTRGRLAVASAMVTAGFAGWLAAALDEQPQAPTAPAVAPSAAAVPMAGPTPAAAAHPGREFQRSGQVIAISHDTLTTAAGGQTTTFRITPQTTQITLPGTSAPYTAVSFAPKQDVVVLGVVHDGVAVATAIADQRAVGPTGPPMDYQLPA